MFSRPKFVGWGFVVLLCLWAVSSEVFSREIARVNLSAGWATFGLVVPRGLAINALQVGSLQTQTDVKNRWADNTVKFAVLTCKVETAGQYVVTAASAGASGSFTPQVPSAAVKFTMGGNGYTATLPSAPSSDNWLSARWCASGVRPLCR